MLFVPVEEYSGIGSYSAGGQASPVFPLFTASLHSCAQGLCMAEIFTTLVGALVTGIEALS